MADVRATPLPQVGSNLRPVIDRAVARPSGVQVATPQVRPDMEMNGLLNGLSVFNQALGQYTHEQISKESERASKLAQQQAAADAARAAPGANYDDMVSGPVPANVPLAHGETYRDTLGTLLADREAVRMRSDLTTEYEQARKDPNFNAKAWLQEKRASVLDNIQNPNIAGRLGMKFTDMEAAILAADEKDRVVKLTETENSALFTRLEENVRADMTPDSVNDEFHLFKEIGKRMGRSQKEMTGLFLNRLGYLSEKKGGDPRLFDIMDQVDPTTGQSYMALGGPEIQAITTQMRDRAKALQYKTQEKDTQQENFKTLSQLNEMLEKDPGKITQEMVAGRIGDHDVFQTYKDAAAFYHHAQKLAAAKLGDQEVSQAFDAGMAGRYSPKVQKEELERRLGPAITQMWKAAVGGDVSQAEQLGGLLLSAQSKYRTSEGVEAVERFVASTISSAPNPNGPDGVFQANATLYRTLSSDPKYRANYFKEDADTLFRRYNSAVSSGADPLAAYKQAYEAISPAAKAAAEKLAKDPAQIEAVKKSTKEVLGSSWWPRMLGGNGRIKNDMYVQNEAAQASQDFYATHPNASQDELKEHLNVWMSRNFIMEPSTGNAVKVPPELANETTREALGEYSKRLQESNKLDGDWKVEYRPAGTEGLVHVALVNGASSKNIGTMTVQSIREAYVAERTFESPADQQALHALTAGVRSGKLDPAFVQANAALIERARRFKGGLSSETLDSLDKMQLETVTRNLQSTPRMSLGGPSMTHLQDVGARGPRVDNKLTASIAGDALTTTTFNEGHQNLAASLITMGEAVVLKASPDPNPEAGMNIGMGYNLKANAANAPSDLKRAGVPEDRIQAVIKGEAQITPQQAQRLLSVTMPRYEKLASDAAEKMAPGLWSKMTPNQRAVMVDIAWQTGNPEQFRKAWTAAASGDAESFRESSKVFYKNAKGERVEDKRRGELRANMLAGAGAWRAAINRYGSFPSNAVEAAALK